MASQFAGGVAWGAAGQSKWELQYACSGVRGEPYSTCFYVIPSTSGSTCSVTTVSVFSMVSSFTSPVVTFDVDSRQVHVQPFPLF